VTSATRRRVLDALVARIETLRGARPTLVGIDGRSAAGKSTLRDELVNALGARGYAALGSSIDDFHTPGHKYRSIRREYTPESYIATGYDYAGFRRCVIDPLRTGGNRLCKAAQWNPGTDTPVDADFVRQRDDVVAVIDGTLLFHPLLEDAWHLTIWLDIDWNTMHVRALARDIAWVKSADEVRRKYRELWQPLHDLYERTMRPRERCDLVIDNRDVDAPVILRYSPASAT
jgi:uridine kinase